VTLETPNFQAYRGEEPPRFVNEAELEYAKILDYYGVPWMYEPHTFVLERDDEGHAGLERADEERLAVAVVPGDLGGEVGNPRRDLGSVEVDLADPPVEYQLALRSP
jgi:hypothetical protein